MQVTLLFVPDKVLARIFLDRVRRKLPTQRRNEQSVFTPKTSSVDRIPAPRVLTEWLRGFRTELLAVYMDFSKAFDSVNRDVLWRILDHR